MMKNERRNQKRESELMKMVERQKKELKELENYLGQIERGEVKFEAETVNKLVQTDVDMKEFNNILKELNQKTLRV